MKKMNYAILTIFFFMVCGSINVFGMELPIERKLEKVKQDDRVELKVAFLKTYTMNNLEILTGQGKRAQDVQIAYGRELVEQVKKAILHDVKHNPERLHYYLERASWNEEAMQAITDETGKTLLQLIQESSDNKLQEILEKKLDLEANWQIIIAGEKEEVDANEDEEISEDKTEQENEEDSSQQQEQNGYMDWLWSFLGYSNE